MSWNLEHGLKILLKKAWGKAWVYVFFCKGRSCCLKRNPAVNAEIEKNELIYKLLDIGVAVGTPQGLVYPVIRDAIKRALPKSKRDYALEPKSERWKAFHARPYRRDLYHIQWWSLWVRLCHAYSHPPQFRMSIQTARCLAGKASPFVP